jgi:hypothetical protein
MPRPWPSFTLLHFGSISFNLLPVQAHPRNIPPHAPARKWKTVFLFRVSHPAQPIRHTQIFSSLIHKSFLLPQTLLR